MSEPAPPIIRDARSADRDAGAAVLTAAFRNGVVARWAEPDPARRRVELHHYFAAVLEHAGAHGTVRYAATGTGLAGVAVWYQYPLRTAAADMHALMSGTAGRASAGALRLTRLEEALAERHPTRWSHLYLAYLAVRPDAQNQRIGTALLTDQGLLGRPVAGFYLEANAARNRALFHRHGYLDHGDVPVTTGDSPPVWPMRRIPPPAPAPPAPAPPAGPGRTGESGEPATTVAD